VRPLVAAPAFGVYIPELSAPDRQPHPMRRMDQTQD